MRGDCTCGLLVVMLTAGAPVFTMSPLLSQRRLLSGWAVLLWDVSGGVPLIVLILAASATVSVELSGSMKPANNVDAKRSQEAVARKIVTWQTCGTSHQYQS
jgi:hypothetical protein